MLDVLAETVGLPESAPHLLIALTHPSFANEQRDTNDNQRLEFLGDAVLGFAPVSCCFVATRTRTKAR